MQQLKIPVKEGPTVLVPHPILSPCTLSHNFSIGANSELFRISFLCCENEQLQLSGRLEIHFSLFVTGYDPSLVDGSGPAMGIEARLWFVVKVNISRLFRLSLGKRRWKSWIWTDWCPVWFQLQCGRHLDSRFRTRFRLNVEHLVFTKPGEICLTFSCRSRLRLGKVTSLHLQHNFLTPHMWCLHNVHSKMLFWKHSLLDLSKLNYKRFSGGKRFETCCDLV